MQTRIDDYLAESRRLGFQLRSRGTFLAGFARFVADRHHQGPLTVELMTEWACQGKGSQESAGNWAVRLARLRHFVRYLMVDVLVETESHTNFHVSVKALSQENPAKLGYSKNMEKSQPNNPLHGVTLKGNLKSPQFSANLVTKS